MGTIACAHSLLRWSNTSETHQTERRGNSLPRAARASQPIPARTCGRPLSPPPNIVGIVGGVGPGKQNQSTYKQQSVSGPGSHRGDFAGLCASRSAYATTKKTLTKGTLKNTRPVLRNHAEVWLRDPKSKLCGRADHIDSAEIIDFKTGEEYPYYVDQSSVLCRALPR